MKNIVALILGVIVLYLVLSFGWSLLNIQSCSYPDNMNELSCEEQAKNQAENCRYLILKWKKVDYDQDLQQCQEWEREHLEIE